MSFLEASLFRRSLGEPAKQKEGAACARLRESLMRFRERAGTLAEEIHRSMPSLTVHGGTHLDSLWEMADLIAGPDYPLNPVEAFALGGAFLLHDLGLGLAAWPEGIDGLKDDPAWKDTVAGRLRDGLGRAPTPEELVHPSIEVEQAALEEWLRLRHAAQAERLAMASWRDPKRDSIYHLLEDVELREALGPILGRIAHSHWWPVSQLVLKLGTTLGAPAVPDVPVEWTLDPLKVAVLLRVADAAHLDARRAPGFLWAMRHPEGISWNHWAFQNHLLKPREEKDQLVFTAARPFSRKEAEAWWLCQDTLRMVDRELRQCDALLADTARPRLLARSVAGVEDPRRLMEYVPVSGWTPVDARIHVSSVADLVERLGGKELYGQDSTVPLRELIQNAADAVLARRMLENRPANWGRITVRMGGDEEGTWIEVEDTGIGMSEAVLSGPLLDFGTTYWGSPLMREEHPGLWAKGFEPNGRFGIGFFSVFMWGSQVRVITRHYEEAPWQARVLEFRTGLRARPLLRPVQLEEQIRDAGTRIRVWVKQRNRDFPKDLASLQNLCGRIAPALDVDLYAEHVAECGIVVHASDWITLDGLELFNRLSGSGSGGQEPLDKCTEMAASNLRLIRGEREQILGRASIADFSKAPAGVVTVGGLQAMPSRFERFAGILVGSNDTVVRHSAIHKANSAELSQWATEQAHLIAEMSLDPLVQIKCADRVNSFGGVPGTLMIAWRPREFVNFDQIATWPKVPDEVVVVLDLEFRLFDEREGISFRPNVVLTTFGIDKFVKEALALAWGSPIRMVNRTEVVFDNEVGTRDGAPIYAEHASLIRNPQVHPPFDFEALAFDLFSDKTES